jgi:hypothetical protein
VDIEALLQRLEADGVLLLSDAALPSIVGLVTGGPIHRSWWGHPRGGDIYRLSNALADHPDVLVAKLVSAKVTFIHRNLWPAVVAVGESRAGWQVWGLSEACTTLLRLVDEVGRLGWDDVPPFLPPHGRSPAEAVRVLELRLLVHTAEEHTPNGAHAKNLETWSAWAASRGAPLAPAGVAEAQEQLELTLDRLNEQHGGRGRLPWQGPARRQAT